MDRDWERSLPFEPIGEAEIASLLRQYDAKLRLTRVLPLSDEGKRNTNYRVWTDDGDSSLVLRVYASGDDGWRRESALFRRMRQLDVPVQRLCYQGEAEGRAFGIYSFAEGRSLQAEMLSGARPEPDLLHALGAFAARIHSVRYGAPGFLDERLQPQPGLAPLADWFGFFLDDRVRERLGEPLAADLSRLIEDRRTTWAELDRHACLVHGDFRPANIAVSGGRVSAVLDWEFAMAGHAIADLGQWFRYGRLFEGPLQAAFVAGYEDASGSKLPHQWERLARLRDLSNLLQMLGGEAELPNRHQDLRALIEATVRRVNDK
ncbi:phosphotransferase family protein [Cohnella nanjingensis]|uniref:Phosphotransferase n=1 Tax=Cohnella nanjingensis TaxID=1387779 RepID=A0A7X0VE51_9BACL|nr:phosphotransferase [Cohnella nanjingensis]MBB6669189.1 phosphotransferase [Cohnella nanjingensis]